jgi:hypothetical protein
LKNQKRKKKKIMGAYVHNKILEYNKNEENARGAKKQRTTSAKTTMH